MEYESSGGRIRVLTLPEGLSHLKIEDARTSDSGNYTCSPSGGVPASLVLNVIEGEESDVKWRTIRTVLNVRRIFYLCVKYQQERPLIEKYLYLPI